MIIAVDFDGTIVKHKYPAIGKEMPYAVKTLKLFQKRGHKLILWTYRAGRDLEKAVQFCNKRGLFFHAVNSNYEGEELDESVSRKIYADLYIDDRNILGIPDWKKLYEILTEENSEESENKKKKFKIDAI